MVSRSKDIKTGIFPNPTTDVINCYIEAYIGAKVNIEIFNGLGQKVSQNIFTEELNDRLAIRQIDGKDFGKGIYTVVFNIDGVRYNHKLIFIE
ncbi:MAG: T9SS type A sorting domain-containing protein [Saprospiraceae bacterium]|nr:T9SS type A sorting domain-containing protein [Saprospiraceae bacterium]